ncbi:hypothetical protein FOZ62_027607 [Perkinsus olseni]|uniref:Uncharacterized protein n=1 Tax=Perkinsus olseni TaxID=32597 RepID=A0A7J6SC25_PEROL|nr:hypothetical protein FOZ62_027607 [Perkinsus olseni]
MSPSSSHNSRGCHYGIGEEYAVSSGSRGLRRVVSLPSYRINIPIQSYSLLRTERDNIHRIYNKRRTTTVVDDEGGGDYGSTRGRTSKRSNRLPKIRSKILLNPSSLAHSNSSSTLIKAISASLSSAKAYPSPALPPPQQGRGGRLVRNKTTPSLGRSMVVIDEMMTAIDDDILQKKARWNRGYRLPGRWKRGQASSSCNGIVMREEEDGDDNMGGASMKAGGGEGASSSSRLDDNTKYTYKPYPHCLNNNEVFDDADTYEVHTPEEWLRLITGKDNDDEEEDYHDMVHNGFLKEDAHSWARRQEVYRRNKEEYYKRIRFINVINNTTSLSSSLPSDNGHITSFTLIPNDEWLMNRVYNMMMPNRQYHSDDDDNDEVIMRYMDNTIKEVKDDYTHSMKIHKLLLLHRGSSSSYHSKSSRTSTSIIIPPPPRTTYDDIINKIAHAIRHPSCSRYYGYAIPWPYGDSSDGGGRRVQGAMIQRGVHDMISLTTGSRTGQDNKNKTGANKEYTSTIPMMMMIDRGIFNTILYTLMTDIRWK